tara:strand:+ start:727 stop:1674 length:948 start_codon:yes stop_codon:yes gene_type:complete
MKTKTKKKVDATTPIKPWAAIITWLILNLIWFSLSPMGTPHPVLSEKGGYREYYEMTVPDVMGASMPFEVICEVNVSDPDQGEVNISWTLWDKEKRLAPNGLSTRSSESPPWVPSAELNYYGELSDCSKLNENIPPGEYELEIRFYDENGSLILWEDAAEIIDGEFTMMYWIYAPHILSGYAMANVLGLIILITDQTARRWKRAKILARRLPMHKQRHKEEWDSLHEQMEGGGDVTVESFEIELGASSEAERERIRESFAEQVDESPEDEELDDEIEIHEELGVGDTKGLEGEAKVDKDIHTVGDLWRRIEDKEN